jgi:Protein of unknown function, DUF488
VLTASYRTWTPALGVPVRTSLGTPRWFQAPLVDWPTVFPWGLLKQGLDEAAFTRRYRHRLDQRAGRVLAELRELREAYGDLTLLCWEPPGTFCHRRVMSAWLAEQLGEEVPEAT